mmetsp:Transcript_13357/g.31783  ORF Transcript_13357/g.31783 Transcript_13357/m.31783 type:complete len:88 (-) Transcript_13357:8-271(-)
MLLDTVSPTFASQALQQGDETADFFASVEGAISISGRTAWLKNTVAKLDFPVESKNGERDAQGSPSQRKRSSDKQFGHSAAIGNRTS